MVHLFNCHLFCQSSNHLLDRILPLMLLFRDWVQIRRDRHARRSPCVFLLYKDLFPSESFIALGKSITYGRKERALSSALVYQFFPITSHYGSIPSCFSSSSNGRSSTSTIVATIVYVTSPWPALLNITLLSLQASTLLNHPPKPCWIYSRSGKEKNQSL